MVSKESPAKARGEMAVMPLATSEMDVAATSGENTYAPMYVSAVLPIRELQ